LLVSILCLILVVLIASGAWLFVRQSDERHKGSDLVGGSFELVDQDRNNITNNSFPNKFKIIYFGFTFCPDVCPMGLTTISEALDSLGTKAKHIQPIFITLDPLRDTAEVLKSYKENFHESIIFLTGSEEQIRSMAKLYKVYFRKTNDADDYLIDHSAITFIMAPSGGYLKHFGPNATAVEFSNFFNSILK
jgi:cytochrome oxidase Cu insertion factor (SCO1/SenC/PrrC family)